MKLRVLGVDLSILSRRYWESNVSNENRHERSMKSVLEAISGFRSGHDRVAICCDEHEDEHGNLIRGVSFRKFIEPQYKWNREPPSPSYFEFMRQLTVRLAADGCSVFWAQEVSMAQYAGPETGYMAEADDTVASLAEWCSASGHALTIVSSDKDLRQLIDDVRDIVMRDPADSDLWTAARVAFRLVKAKEDRKDTWLGVPPQMVPHWLALAGDGADNFECFPGWEDETGKHPGIGEITAVRLLRRFTGGALEVIEALDKKDDKGGDLIKGGVATALRHGKPTPKEAAMRGLLLSMLHRDLLIDFSVLEAVPVVKPVASQAAYFAPSPAAPASADAAMLSAIDAGADVPPPAWTTERLSIAIASYAARAIEAAMSMDRDAATVRFNEIRIELRNWCETYSAPFDAAHNLLKAKVSSAIAASRAVSEAKTAEKAEQSAASPGQTIVSEPADPPTYLVEPSVDLIVVAPTSINPYRFQPTGLYELQETARMLFDSRMYPKFPTFQAIAAVMIEGNERGMTIGSALRNAHVINGLIGWSAAAMIGWIKASKIVDYFDLIESTWTVARIEFKVSRTGRVVPYEATIEDAKKKGYLEPKGHPIWKSDAKSMLVSMAYREAARAHFPEIVAGIPTPDELEVR